MGESLGAKLAGGEVLALSGDLGSGKTTFVQGLARGMGIGKQIVSPTFIIMRKYELTRPQLRSAGGLAFYHVDLYRLEGDLGSELENLGLTDIWEDPKNVVVIEWAEKAEKYLPEKTRWIKFENLGEEERKVSYK